MIEYPPLFESLIQHLAKLPGVGRRGAERMALSLLKQDGAALDSFARVLASLSRELRACKTCGFMTQDADCVVCCNTGRNQKLLCIVETHADVIAFEKSGGFNGVYHVLGGKLSPLKGVTPQQLNLATLRSRVESQGMEEVILATSPDVEGDATALYIQDLLKNSCCRLTQIGRGLPNGSTLGVADGGTLRLALESRRNVRPGLSS